MVDVNMIEKNVMPNTIPLVLLIRVLWRLSEGMIFDKAAREQAGLL
jgi:hypothetical protein